MEPEDFLTPEVGVTAVVVGALCSPRVRQVLRKGLVYGLAGILEVGELAKGVARGLGKEVQQVGASAVATAKEAAAREEREQQEAGTP